jgi:predicted MFS family arabinose efflux permease
MTETRQTAEGGHAAVSAVLFLCLFAGQAGLIALSPVLVDVAHDLDVSTATAGQLRTVTGLAAGCTALALGRVAGRFGLGRQLLAASILLALGLGATAAAPGFLALALAQVPIGLGVGVLTTAGTVAAAEWAPAAHRTRVLSWALVGQPAAWIVGMPLIGIVGERSWRLAVLVLPMVAALAAGAAVAGRAGGRAARRQPARLRSVLADRALARWLGSELLANTAWAGTLVYAGALFVETYGTSAAVAGLLLAAGAGAYVAGNLVARRFAHGGPRPLLVALALALAVADALFGAVRPALAASTALFSLAALLAGARTLVASAAGLATAPELRPAVMGVRVATMQLGHFTGSLAGGAALAAGGYGALGVAVGALFLAAAATLAPLPALHRLRARRVAVAPDLPLPAVYPTRG